jgi:UDP-N-acetylglucosamine 2-epimerase
MRIALIIGTRPEAIKMVPVLMALKGDYRAEATLIVTGQHRQMLDQVLSVFGLVPDVDLDLMLPNQSLASFTAAAIAGVQNVLMRLKPDAVLVHGDTTTCFASAVAAFYERIPIGHVEAGLRTYDFQAPWPEEMNRRLVDPICRWCFAPTQLAAENLQREHVSKENIFITGNTAIDTLSMVRQMLKRSIPNIPGLSINELNEKKLILVTGHRRESFGAPFEDFCLALRDIVRARDDLMVVYPVHLNPNVQKPVRKILGTENQIYLIDPLEYTQFIYLIDRCYLIITDSGGIQEEAPSFGKPVLVTRAVTERPEAMAAGLAKLVGMDRVNIVKEVTKLLNNAVAYKNMISDKNPYGDGKAALRIVDILCKTINVIS